MSSRNVYLNARQRRWAPVIYQTLSWVRSGLQERPKLGHVHPLHATAATVETLQQAVVERLTRDPQVPVQIEYVSVADNNSGREVRRNAKLHRIADELSNGDQRALCISVAATVLPLQNEKHARPVRLLDNVVVNAY